jgi:hypothetical protein
MNKEQAVQVCDATVGEGSGAAGDTILFLTTENTEGNARRADFHAKTQRSNTQERKGFDESNLTPSADCFVPRNDEYF